MSTNPEQLTRTLADRYRIDREIGRGGMAIVYLADDLKHGRAVAIKVLHGEHAASIGRERFLREIEVAAQLTHPHILPLYDSGAANGQLYYVMPYVAGGSLRTWLEREKQLSVEDALRIAREIASALGHAHQKGLVHRDIKPENVLISEGLALVADFGIARALSTAPAHRITTAGGMIGTPRYMAPEQVTGSADLDGRADLYALACVAYEMLSGQPPFAGPDEGLPYQHLSVAPRLLTDLRPLVPPGVAAVISRGLAKLPADRFVTAARFAEALTNAVTGDHGRATHDGAGGATTPNNLPRERSHFIGRERELAECARALDDSRLLTITGIGGSGKTRLALKLAEALLDRFPGGVWYADFAPINDAERIALTLAAALDLREEPGTPLLDTIAKRLHNKKALIILDNCEHVLGSAAELADRLILSSEDLEIIATSREGLGIEGERLFALRSLSVPARSEAVDLAAAEASEAVRLFVDRAGAIDASFALTEANAPTVAEICRRLDGIPLAIELAAARIRVLKVEEISARLDDRFRLLTGGSRTALPRHQTLRATIQWSYDLLTGEEQHLLRLLAVFAGGWTLEAATRVAGDQADEFEVLERITRLVDKSLVTMDRESEGETRYFMLETVRQYALELLNETDEVDAARTRHQAFYLGLAEQGVPGLASPDQSQWTRRLTLEQENFLAAHAWCDQSPARAVEGLRLVGALRRFWLVRGLLELGRRVTLEALGREGAGEPTAARVRALYAASNFAFSLGDYARARDLGEESLIIARKLGTLETLCDALRALGAAWSALGDLKAAKLHAQELLVLARQLGDPVRLAGACSVLAECLLTEGDLDHAEPLYLEAAALNREIGDTRNLAILLGNVSLVAIGRRDPVRAAEVLREAASIIGPVQCSGTLDMIGSTFALREEWLRAARYFGGAETQRRLSGWHREPADEAINARHIARTREALGDVAFEAALAEGRATEAEILLANAQDWL
jgi:non-specific serine/threonine protein kinase